MTPLRIRPSRFFALRTLTWLALTLLALSGGALHAAMAKPVQQLGYRILQEQPHDASMFTQGLLLEGDWLVESSGGFGSSRVRRYKAATGDISREMPLPRNLFAEGVAQVDDRLLLLTWRKGICLELDARTFELITQHRYQGEGWGLTYNGRHLIMSDGSDQLTFRRPSDFASLHSVTVTGAGRSWNRLNELEYAQGLVWTNVWQENVILAINPRSGQVQGILDLSALVRRNSTRPNHSVLNGIAYDKEKRAFWITGKLWPRRYLIEVDWNTDSAVPPG